ncbi:MAG: vitamin K epoxide reductase family protein [Actinobacteria bacterium]|nr:vitamin K epoxide reductase family protein [Actinomycetota bacterium]
MLVSSVLGLIAALVLSVDAIMLAADPNAALSCNVSETISCAKVGITWQANLLGWPNAFLGLIAEPVVITVAVAGLGGVRFPRWFMNTAMVFYSVGLVFAYWLFYEAYFVIGALCPWCLLVTVTTTTVFMSLMRVNLADNTFRLSERAFDRVQFLLRIGADVWLTILLIAVMAAMVISRYL